MTAEGHALAWVDPGRAKRLLDFDAVFVRDAADLAFAPELNNERSRTDALAEVTRVLATEGALTAWRDEMYAVATSLHGAPLFRLERAAARYFGIVTYAAHVNGLIQRDGELFMWIARRSMAKAIDPGQLDNLVGGGIRAGTTVNETMRREAWEEAGIDDAVSANAYAVNAVRICRGRPDGLQREVVHVFDLVLPMDFTPRGVDGEAVEHRLVPTAEAARLIALEDGPDVVTADASLVIMDCLMRHGCLDPDSAHYLMLAAVRWPSLSIC